MLQYQILVFVVRHDEEIPGGDDFCKALVGVADKRFPGSEDVEELFWHRLPALGPETRSDAAGMMTQYLLLAISYNMELSETKIKIFCNFAAYCRNNIFVLPMKIRLFTIPNLLTLASLLCGSFAVVSALVYGDLALAFWLTIAAGVFDYSDGFVARLLKCLPPSAYNWTRCPTWSRSLRPSAVLFVLWNNSLPADAEAWLRYGGSALCFAVAAFSALRLAKFNIDETQHTEFCGFLLQPMRCFSYLWGGLR